MTEKEQAILDYLNIYGILLCNENKYMPSLFEVGGDWDSVVSLIEKREVFYSKVYKKRTCYLSRELYFLLKGYRQNLLNMPSMSMDIYGFLSENGPADTDTIKTALMISKKDFDKAFDILLARLLATAVKRGKTLGSSWCTFVWGTYGEWEIGAMPIPDENEAYNRIMEILGLSLSEKEILKLI